MSRNNKITLFTMVIIGIAIIAYSMRDVKLSLLIHDLFTLNPWWILVLFYVFAPIC